MSNTTARRIPFGNDRTEYARSLGYEMDTPVLVRDGIVISHRNLDWAEFCARCRSGRYTTRPVSIPR